VTSRLLDEVVLGRGAAQNRVVFGPHVTNLGSERALSERHVAYYARRARGGCGVVVTEVASVHDSDWPYERAPLASECAAGWGATVDACRPHGTAVLAGLGHAGMQGSTAWSQDVLWAPSLVPNVLTHEQPLAMGAAELDALVTGFASAAKLARRSGCDGVELNAGQHSLLRQFCSGLTNLRADAYGTDRALLLREVLAGVRAAVGDGVLGLRFSADELAPWAGITPDEAVNLLLEVTTDVDYVCVVRGSIYTEAATQPDGHEVQGFNVALTARITTALREGGRSALVCAQGSIVEVAHAEEIVISGAADLVEMTRAQIAEPDLCRKLASGRAERIRPCLLCNQHCTVRDPRNPIVSCSVNPVAGHELDDAHLDVDAEAPQDPGTSSDAVVVGGGIAGLETARLLAHRGHRVTLYEQGRAVGGALPVAAKLPGRERLGTLCDWLAAEVAAAGVRIETRRHVEAGDLNLGPLVTLVVATGGVAARVALRDGDDGSVPHLDAAEIAEGATVDHDVVVLDTVGGPVGIGAAEQCAAAGARVTLVTPDVVAGSQLSLTSDLVAANARLAAAGVRVVAHAAAVAIRDGAIVLEDRFTGTTTRWPAAWCVDAGHRIAGPATWPGVAQVIGDAVAPRGILMAMLEARRVAVEPGGGAP
jgi:mycofactocin system FadH/OYE family oxidoreductase 1